VRNCGGGGGGASVPSVRVYVPAATWATALVGFSCRGLFTAKALFSSQKFLFRDTKLPTIIL